MREWTEEELKQEQEQFAKDFELEEKIRNHKVIQELLAEADVDEWCDIEADITKAVQMYRDGWNLDLSTNPIYELMFDILKGVA